MPFPNLLKNIEIEIPPGEKLAVNFVCEISPNKKFKLFSRNFSYWVKRHTINFEM